MSLSGEEGARSRPISIADITATAELWARAPHMPDVKAEALAMRRLAEALKSEPSQVFQTCVELGLELCHAHSCGISLAERTAEGEEVFRWIAVAGDLQDHLFGTMPRFFSPCAICVESTAPLLMFRPERFYTYIDVGRTFNEVLLIPLTDHDTQIEGTIWICAHNETRKFDREDARVMQWLSVFVATALHFVALADEAREEAARKELAFRELDHRVKNTLAMTAGLLRHQMRQTVEPGARDAIEAASAQVLAIGRAHQVAGGDGVVDLAVVVTSICTEILGADPRFALTIDVQPSTITARKAPVVALIVNELITNAVKHGLAGRTNGTVGVSLSRTGDNLLALSVTDDGASLPAELNRRSGSGLDLVNRLVAQLAGVMKVETEPKRFTVLVSSGRVGLKRASAAPSDAISRLGAATL